MSPSPATPGQPDAPASTGDATGVERQRAKLDRLGDLALELTEILVARAREAAGEADLERSALAVSRVSRVVRVTCALHTRLAQTQQAIEKEQRSLDNGGTYRDATGHTDQVVAR